jgi:NAD(P)-dependent dehydrogenase (short-subunit alcohol dehydrogenase family)
MRLAGKNALITGATSGIGLATAKLFASEGARVFITGRSDEKLVAAQAAIGQPTVALNVDVRSVGDLKRMAKALHLELGDRGLDVFFANAGIAYSTPLLGTDESRFAELMDVNVKGLFFSMQAVTPLLARGASVVLNSAWLTEVGMPGFSILSATKAAVRSFARSWSAELLDRGVRVNVVSPGAVDTPIFELEGASSEQLIQTKNHLASRIPVGRMGTPDDIAEAVLFLASDASKYMLGSEVVVDGGFGQL